MIYSAGTGTTTALGSNGGGTNVGAIPLSLVPKKILIQVKLQENLQGLLIMLLSKLVQVKSQ